MDKADEREATKTAATISPEKLKELMMKVRKGATASLTLAQIAAILEAIGGKLTPIVGLVPQFEGDQYSFIFVNDPAGVEEKLRFLKSISVSSLPSKPKPGVIYVTRIFDPREHGGHYTIEAESYIGANGVRVEAPDGKKAELFPHRHSLPELRFYDREGKKPRPFPTYRVLDWLDKNTDWIARVNEALGMEEHVPGAARTRSGTGSCPVCFQNVKLSGSGMMVLHGYKRPGYGFVAGKCFGVGYPPFEVSVKGVVAFLNEVLLPGITRIEARLASLRTGDVRQLSVGKRVVTSEDPAWGMYLKEAISSTERELKGAQEDRDAYTRLKTYWVERPLPKEGERERNWFSEGQKASGASRLASLYLAPSRVAERFLASPRRR